MNRTSKLDGSSSLVEIERTQYRALARFIFPIFKKGAYFEMILNFYESNLKNYR